jgi:hypothetical protein
MDRLEGQQSMRHAALGQNPSFDSPLRANQK